MNKSLRLFIPIILFSLLGNALRPVDSTQAAWPHLQPGPGAVEIQPVNAPIDPNVYVTLEQEGIVQVLVILQQQADLSGAPRLQTKTEKGAFVYQQLTKIAEQTQVPLRAFLDSRGAEYRSYWIQNLLMVSVDENLLDELARQPGIERIESYIQPEAEPFEQNLGWGYGVEFGPFPPVITASQTVSNLGKYAAEFRSTSPTTVEWNIQRVGAPDVWAMGFTGDGAVVGVLDTGVEWTHPALVNHYRPQIPGAPGRHDYNWYDGVSGSAVPIDYGFHGTLSMGHIVGDEGGQNQIGMAPGANWIACAGSGSPYANPLDCYQWFLAPTKLDGTDPRPDLAPDVINQIEPSPKDYHAATQALYAAGIYITQPAGNNGPQCSTLDLPMNKYPEITATGAFDINDNIWLYSSRGPGLVGHDSLVKPDITAPGVNIRVSVPEFWGFYINGISGTSLAAPHVAGAVALLISAVPELRGRVDLIEMLLKTNAEPRASTECTPGGGVPNNVWGWGMLNVYQAVLAAQALELGAIEGQMVEAGSLEPVEGAKLTFADTALDWPYPDRSDSLGQYDHTLPVGTYVITATQYGYLDSMVSGVEISPGVTTTQNIEMFLAPIWNISGVVTDSQTGEPLFASFALEDTPASTESNPETGAYSVAAAQGEWWLVVTSPGYAEEAIKIKLDQDLVQNFSLDPIFNYYMRRSVDGGCGPQFNWLDATNGTPRPVDWLTPVFVPLPAGKSFTFYENTYSGFYINAHGIITFGSAYSDMGGPIPNPAKPNNAIYAFSTFLNPGEDSEGGGIVYTKYMDSRYFVIEWYQVMHWVNHDPETFEIILDLDTGRIKLQYLTVGDATGVVAGVENSSGTEATLYAYDQPELFTNNTAVEFYPWFGVPPPSGGAGEMLGTVTDNDTGIPIAGALVTAEAYTTGETFTYTTDLTGTYSASLCADWYEVMAEAYGYEPSPEVHASVYPDIQTIQDFALISKTPPNEVSITGPTDGWVNTLYSFTATVDPLSTTLPLEYVWLANGQAPITHTGGLTDTVSFTWDMPGMQAITVTASNHVGSVFDTHAITITDIPPEGLVADNDSPTELGNTTHLSATVAAGSNVIFTWAFGDGMTGNGDVIMHTYPAVGDYTAIVTATNEAISITSTTDVTITDIPPEGLVADNDSPTELGNTTHLSATVAAGSNVSFAWDFGDGMTGNGGVLMHTYPAVGDYTAIVTATNEANSITATTEVTITDIPPEGLVADNDSPTELGNTTHLSATVAAGSNVLFTWSFGDGESGSGALVTHTFPFTGIYTATVTATNSANTITAATNVTVTHPMEKFYLPLVIKVQTLEMIDPKSVPPPGLIAGIAQSDRRWVGTPVFRKTAALFR